MTRPGIELRVYRLGGERSTTRPTNIEKGWWKELSMVATPLKSRILKLDKTKTKQKGKKTKQKEK